MKFKDHLCPECFEYPVGVLEQLFATAALRVEEETHSFEYAGGSEMHFDTQEPMKEGRNVTLTCAQKHEWKTEMYA